MPKVYELDDSLLLCKVCSEAKISTKRSFQVSPIILYSSLRAAFRVIPCCARHFVVEIGVIRSRVAEISPPYAARCFCREIAWREGLDAGEAVARFQECDY